MEEVTFSSRYTDEDVFFLKKGKRKMKVKTKEYEGKSEKGDGEQQAQDLFSGGIFLFWPLLDVNPLLARL